MRAGRTTLTFRLSYFVMAAVMVAAILCAEIYRGMVRHMEEICEYKGRQTANRLIGEAIDECLAEENGEYITITRGSDGRIMSIETDPKRINKLENDLKGRINSSLAHIDDNEMSVPIGTLTGITALSGRGSEVKIKLHQVGAVDAVIESELSDAGVNQTRHTIKLSVQAELSAILPGHSTDVVVNDEYIISETVIVGEQPSIHY